jgi:uncharacterized membrane protein
MMTGAGWAIGLGGWLWMILEVAVAIAVLGALVWVIGAALPGRQRSPIGDAAQIVDARFARGEITEAEYEQARNLLAISQPDQATLERNAR